MGQATITFNGGGLRVKVRESAPKNQTLSYLWVGLGNKTHNTVESSNNRHVGGEHFVHCSKVPLPEVEMYICRQGGKQFVHCREVVHSSECPLLEVPL